MKLRPPTNPSIPPQISEHMDNRIWEHPWNAHMRKWDAEREIEKGLLKKPKPPTKEAIEKAKFKDKTYQWKPK